MCCVTLENCIDVDGVVKLSANIVSFSTERRPELQPQQRRDPEVDDGPLDGIEDEDNIVVEGAWSDSGKANFTCLTCMVS